MVVANDMNTVFLFLDDLHTTTLLLLFCSFTSPFFGVVMHLTNIGLHYS